jgi:hypothetical protein
MAAPPGAMMPAPPGGMGMMAPGMGGPMGGGGGGGPLGEVRSPVTVTIICCVCGFYYLYWFYFKVLPELKAYLGKTDEELNPTKELILGLICTIFSILTLMKTGKWIQEAQQRAGRPNPEDKGTMFLIMMFVFFPIAPYMIQKELNKIWDPNAQ